MPLRRRQEIRYTRAGREDTEEYFALPVTFRARMTNQATGSGRPSALTLPVVAVRCFNRGLSGGISDERTLCFFIGRDP